LSIPPSFLALQRKRYNSKGVHRKNGKIGFRRWLPGFINQQWEELREKVMTYPITDEEDMVKWGWKQWEIHCQGYV
jgi:hypothetical protein